MTNIEFEAFADRQLPDAAACAVVVFDSSGTQSFVRVKADGGLVAMREMCRCLNKAADDYGVELKRREAGEPA
jgi:hypothetical protein